MKSPPRFSLSILILSALAVAIAFTCYNQWQQQSTLSNLSTRLRAAESELDFRRSVDSVISGLNLYDAIHQRAFQIIGRTELNHNPEDTDEIEQFYPDNPRRITLDGNGNRTILIFCDNSYSSPGYVNTVAALLEGKQLIDIEIRESDTRFESHTTSVEDDNDDGQNDLVFNCQPDGFAIGNPQKRVSYPIGPDGFGAMVQATSEVDSD